MSELELLTSISEKIGINHQALLSIEKDVSEIKQQLKDGDEHFKELMPFMQNHKDRAAALKGWHQIFYGRLFTGILGGAVVLLVRWSMPWFK